jgi:hypothetical protein
MASKKASPAKPENLKALIERRRPGFPRIVKQTQHALALYFGDEELYPLIPILPKEEDEKHQIRKRAVADGCPNYLKEIAETFVEGVFFAQQPTRKAAPVLEEWLKTAYHKFFVEQFAPFSLFLPEMFIQVGAPPKRTDADGKDVEAANASQQREMGLFPTLAVHLPHTVLSFEECDRKITSLVLQCGDKYEVWDGENCAEVSKEGNTIRTEAHGFKRCPFVRAIYRENLAVAGLPRIGHAYLSSCVGRAKAALENYSQLWEARYFHLHPKLASDPETIAAMLETGTGAGIPIPENKVNAGNTRYLVMPNTEIDKLFQTVYVEDPKLIYREARVRDRSNEGTMASGIAKAMDLVPEVKALKQVAGFWQYVDEQILDLATNGQNGSNTPVSAEYSGTYDTKSPAEVVGEVAATTKAMKDGALPTSPTANSILALKLYDLLLPDLDKAKQTAIEDELKPPEEGEEPAPGPINTDPEQVRPPEGDGEEIQDEGKTPPPPGLKKKGLPPKKAGTA